MEENHVAAATAAGDLLEKKGAETDPDAVHEVACGHGGAGDAATAVAGSVTSAADLEEKDLAGSDCAMPELEVKPTNGAVHAVDDTVLVNPVQQEVLGLIPLS